MNNFKNQTGHHYETEKGVHIVYKLDERKKKVQLVWCSVYFPNSLSVSLTSQIEGFIHALIYIWASDNNQVRGAWNLIIKVYKIVGHDQVKSFCLESVPSYKRRGISIVELGNIQEFTSYL